MSGARFLTRDPIEAITRSAYGYVHNNPINFVDPLGLYSMPTGLPSLGDLWHGFADQVGCGFQQLAGYVGDGLQEIGGFVWDHRVGALQVLSFSLLAGSLYVAWAPALVAYSSWGTGLYLTSIAADLGSALMERPGKREERVTEVVGQNALGLGIGQVYKASGLAPDVLTRMVGSFFDVVTAVA